MDYLMPVGLIKTVTTIWICWFTTKILLKYNVKDLSSNFIIFFLIIGIYAAGFECNTNIL